MLLVSKAISHGVAPPAPGWSIGSVCLPWVRGPVQQPGDRGAAQLDLADLRRAHPVQQVRVGLGGDMNPKVDAPKQVRHHVRM